ncbi:MAG: hypothetical protein H6873_00460 [Hyphomicrobiaceae bacterium]|nr:hypothetical protein [Hyphomicrobiaceae bacterium]
MGKFYAGNDYSALGRSQAPKARMLGWLRRRKLKVPEFWVYVPDAGEAPDDHALARLFPSGVFAVRSASMVEDSDERSFAGQFETVLDVHAPDGLVDAIRKVLEASASERLSAYGGAERAVRQHVIIQRMVAARVSGVAFSRNPMTGLNEVVVEAVEGRGDRLVDEGATPNRYVWRGRGLTVAPSDGTLPSPIVTEIVEATTRLEKALGKPIDLEWSWDGDTLWWLQARPITGLGDVRLFSNRISREVMPGMITPLVWSINVPLVNGAWIRFLERGIGPTGLQPDELARQFAFRSYFNMTALGRVFELLGMPPDALEVMMGLPNTPRPSFKAPQKLIVRLPRLLGFAGYLWTFERRINPEIGKIRRAIAAIGTADWAELDAPAILKRIEQTLPEVGRAAELNIVVPVLANVYAAALRKAFAKAGQDYSEIDLTRGMASYADFDPKPLLQQIGQELSSGGDASAEIEDFLRRFGHLSENTNDLALPTWRERPAHVREMAEAIHAAEAAKGHENMSLGDALAGQSAWIRLIGRRAQRFQLHREAVSYLYALLYAQLRPALTVLGEILVNMKNLAHAEDVFFLGIEELRNLVSGTFPADPQAVVADRKSQFEAARDVRMPETIYSDNFQPLPEPDPNHKLRELTGVGVARGQAKGPFRVLRGFDDFNRVQHGDIIVIPFSDVSWTPVFARAAGVVSEAGGMLSHSAIVAREYGIPCIVSVESALDLPDGAKGMIDGVSGTVLVLEEKSND